MITSSHLVSLERETDIYLACEMAATLATKAGFDRYRIADIETAVSEICSNALRHADGGWASFRLLASRFEVVVTDRGPGFDDRRRSSAGLGIGLEGARRLMGELTITPLVDGSMVTISHPLPGSSADATSVWSVHAVFRAKVGHATPGDAATAVELGDGSLRVALADGLGSGPEAAAAAAGVLDGMNLGVSRSPAEALKAADSAARATRGAAATVVFVSSDLEGLHAGLGDVACQVTRPEIRLPAAPGIVGVGHPHVTDTPFGLAPGAVLFMWTDGMHMVDGAWREAPPPGSEVAWMEEILLEHADLRDDAALLLARSPR